MLKQVMQVVNKFTKARMSGQLTKMGLMAEDLIVETSDYKEALLRLPANVLEERNRRIRRAFDLSCKHEELPEDMRNYDPFESYLGGEMEKAKQKRLELEIIDRA
uniref:Cytochrome b-c1 complex subunit 7 n=1 Tax=Spongospora subterranea TaxID=70186 RepID=A0A0H5QJF7_9EUKA|eukprot:CRZ01441.1 hypothetical protein [Spongospora subterranea]